MPMKPGWDKATEESLKKGVLEMSADIHQRAIVLAPVKTRALANSGVVEPIPNGYRIRFGSGRVPYARLRHFVNRLHPSTVGYLSKAAESVGRGDLSKYFRSKI